MRQLELLNDNICRYFGSRNEGPATNGDTAVRQVNASSGQGVLAINQARAPVAPPMKTAQAPEATLSKMPRNLIELWKEYQFGLNGRKAANLFTTGERNTNRKIKQKYYRRSVIWQCMVKQIDRGLTIEEAAQELYAVYGSKSSISYIIELMIRDKKKYKDNGGYNPSLSV